MFVLKDLQRKAKEAENELSQVKKEQERSQKTKTDVDVTADLQNLFSSQMEDIGKEQKEVKEDLAKLKQAYRKIQQFCQKTAETIL